MRYSTTINNLKATEWGLTIQQAYLFSWFYELPSWANKVMIENEIFYFASKNKAVEELPILTDKTDTMYRYYRQLEDLGLVLIKKIDGKDYIALTAKAKEWNFSKSEYSENNPSIVGNLSENNSDLNPIYNNINTNKNIKDSIEKRKLKFSHSLQPFLEIYGKDMLNNFYSYWTEHSENDKKMKFEKQKSFGIDRRLKTWKSNDEKFNVKEKNINEINDFHAKRKQL